MRTSCQVKQFLYSSITIRSPKALCYKFAFSIFHFKDNENTVAKLKSTIRGHVDNMSLSNVGVTSAANLVGKFKVLLYFLMLSGPIYGQDFPALTEGIEEFPDEGWYSLTNYKFVLDMTLVLLLATVLAAVIAYHPKSHRSMESIEKVEAPKVYILYSVIGALIGIMVLRYGLVVGFVVFGIGGLTRFRTSAGSITKTGRMIFVTLIGLSCGLNLPHVAILSTIFGFALIYIMDWQITYRMVVKGLRFEHLPRTAVIYRQVLEEQECKILSENKDFMKLQVAFIFRPRKKMRPRELERLFLEKIPSEVKGVLDWELG